VVPCQVLLNLHVQIRVWLLLLVVMVACDGGRVSGFFDTTRMYLVLLLLVVRLLLRAGTDCLLFVRHRLLLWDASILGLLLLLVMVLLVIVCWLRDLPLLLMAVVSPPLCCIGCILKYFLELLGGARVCVLIDHVQRCEVLPIGGHHVCSCFNDKLDHLQLPVESRLMETGSIETGSVD
jgi:hypothetical protein